MKKNYKKITKICLIIFIIFSLIFSLFLPIIYVKLHYKTTYKNIIESELKLIENKNNELNTTFVLSIILAESGFNANAKSSKDAFGLMQLTYPTANEVAQKLNLTISINDLFNPKINIKLGVNYLQYLFEQNLLNETMLNKNLSNEIAQNINLNGNIKNNTLTTQFATQNLSQNIKNINLNTQINPKKQLANFKKINLNSQLEFDKQLVLMSYNAGLNRVKSWLENNEITFENEFCVCPYSETTNYVKKVINNQKIYNKIVKNR